MIKLDLITGFLGAGKTTFIKKYVEYLVRNGENVGILENDYGAINVDVMMLNDVLNDRCDIETIAGGCDKETYKRRFKTKLIAMAMSGYTHCIMEPSGIFDLEDFFDVINEEPVDRWFSIGSIITIADIYEDYSQKDNNYFIKSQLSNCGIVILSKVHNKSKDKLDVAQNKIYKILKELENDSDIIGKNWNDLTDEDFEVIKNAGYKNNSNPLTKINANYESLFFMNIDFNSDKVDAIIKKIFNDTAYGKVYRIKGFYKKADVWYEINATKNCTNIEKVNVGQEVIIIIGNELNRKKIEEILN